MRCHGWRWALVLFPALCLAVSTRGETPLGDSNPAATAAAPTERGRARRTTPPAQPAASSAIAPAAGPEVQPAQDRAAAASYEQPAGVSRLPSTADQPAEFVSTAAAMREAEIEARLAALETSAFSLADDKKGDKKDGKGEKPWYEVGSDLSMTAVWKDGLELSTKNKDFRIHIGGRFQIDGSAFYADPNIYNGTVANNLIASGPATDPPGALQLRDNGIGNTYGNGVDVRRARFRIDGTMYEQIEWAAEFDFVNSANIANTTRALTAPTDLWVNFKSIPFVQNVKIGNQKEAIGFEHMVSSRYLPFMERSYNQDAFYGGLFNGFTPGIAVLGTYGDDEDGTYNVGLFQPTNNVFAFNSGLGDYSVVGRLTKLLYWEEDGRNMIHVGGSARQASLISSNVTGNALNDLRYRQYRTRDAIRAGLSGNWPTPANIILQGDNEQTFNLEFVAVKGSWTFQSEYLVNVVHDARYVPFLAGLGTGSPVGPTQALTTYHGGYMQLMYFLTGEHDHYGKKGGFFEKVRPYENFFCVPTCDGHCSGWGAWQVGARYNYLCLNDGFLDGGILHNGTFGVNWFLNPNMKFQLNYMLTYRDSPAVAYPGNANPGDGVIHGVGMRMAWDF